MPTTVNPTPESARTPQIVKDCTILQLGKSFYSAQTFDGHETYFTTAELILDRTGHHLHPVWEENWTEIAPGVRSKLNQLEIHSAACPITVSFKREREGRTWNRRNDDYDYHSAVDHYTVRYEVGS